MAALPGRTLEPFANYIRLRDLAPARFPPQCPLPVAQAVVTSVLHLWQMCKTSQVKVRTTGLSARARPHSAMHHSEASCLVSRATLGQISSMLRQACLPRLQVPEHSRVGVGDLDEEGVLKSAALFVFRHLLFHFE